MIDVLHRTAMGIVGAGNVRAIPDVSASSERNLMADVDVHAGRSFEEQPLRFSVVNKPTMLV